MSEFSRSAVSAVFAVGVLLRWLAKWVLLACAVAVLAGTASAWLMFALEWAAATRGAHHWLVLLMPLAGFVAAWCYRRWGQAVEGGNNLLIDEVHAPQQHVQLRMVPLIFGSTVLSHLTGASVGREGTAVQMGGALAEQLGRVLRISKDERRLLLTVGISAGFASLFGTPLAATVFALEVLALGQMRYNALLPCAVAAVLGDQVGRLWGIGHAHYVLGYVPQISLWSLLAVGLAGAVFGLVARCFAQGVFAVGGWMKRRVPNPVLRPVLGGAVLGVLALLPAFAPYLGLGDVVIAQAFNGALPWYTFLGKLLFTVASLGVGFKGGEVTPLFYIGATLGNALAPLLHLPVPLLAALGFAAVFAAATNTPVAGTLLAMELFGSGVGSYALLACVLAYVFSGMSGIYRAQRVGGHKHGGWLVPEGIKLAEAQQLAAQQQAQGAGCASASECDSKRDASAQ